MTAGAEVVCSEVVCKVEIEKCVSGLNLSGVNAVVGGGDAVDCNVGGNGNGDEIGIGNVGGGDCTFVFVNGGVEVSGGDSGDTGGVNVDEVDRFKKEELGSEKEGLPVDPLVLKTNGVVQEATAVSVAEMKAVKDDVNFENGSTVDPPVVLVTNGGIARDANGHLDKVSDLADEVDQFTKEEIGVEKEGIPVDPLVLKTNGIVHESITVSVAEVTAVKDDANLKNGSTVDPPVVLLTKGTAQDSNGHLDKVSGEQEANVKSTDDIGSGLIFGLESTLNAEENCQGIVSELDFVIKPSDVIVTQSLPTPDVINRTDESLTAPFTISNTDHEVMVNDESESNSNLIDKAECRVVDGSGKTSEDLGSQVTADEPEFCGSPIKERERKVPVDGSDSTGSLVENQECPVSVDEPEPSANHIEKVESNTIGMELDRKSEEHQELLVITSEVNLEVFPNHACSMIKAENKKAEGTEICSGIGSEEKPGSGFVLSEKMHALANGQVENLELGDTQISGTEADESSEKLRKVAESVGMEVSTEEREDQVKVQDVLNLEVNTAESVNEAEVSLEAETDIVTVIHENIFSQYGVSNCIDKPQEGLQQEASAENVETTNTMELECNSFELLVEKDNGSLSNLDDLTVVVQKVETESDLGTENKSAEGMDCGTGIKNVDVSDGEKETEVKDAEYVPHLVTEARSHEAMNCGTGIENVDASDDDDEKETEVKDADDLAVFEQKVEKNISAEGMDCGTGIENVDVSDDDEKETKVKDAEDVPHPVTDMSPEGMDCGTRVESVASGDEEKEIGVKDAHVESVHHFIPENRSSEDRDCETGIKNVDFPDAPVGYRSTLRFSDTIVNNGAVIEFGSIGLHETTLSIQNEVVEDMNGVKSDVPNSSAEGEVNNAIAVQNEEVEVLEYNFLIKIPRFEDENFRDQIRSAQELVEEKTRLRDSIRAKVLEKKGNVESL